MKSLVNYDYGKNPEHQVSYWQQGCNDGKAGLKPAYPLIGHLAATGYLNGYKFGCEQRMKNEQNSRPQR